MANPLALPVFLSVIIRHPVISPNSVNSRLSHSSSIFQLKLPTNKFLIPSSSVLVFLAEGVCSASALRFFVGASSSASESLASESSESEPLESALDSVAESSESLSEES